MAGKTAAAHMIKSAKARLPAALFGMPVPADKPAAGSSSGRDGARSGGSKGGGTGGLGRTST